MNGRRYGWEGVLTLVIADLCLNLASGREGDSFDWFWAVLAAIWFVFSMTSFAFWYADYRELKRKAGVQ